MNSTNQPDPNSLPMIGEKPRADVPVFDCHVILSFSSSPAKVVARVARLPEIQGEGGTERDALLQVVKKFKERMQFYVSNNETPPWLDSPDMPAEGEQERWIPVHL